MSTPESVILENIDCPLGCEKNDEFVTQGHDLLLNLPGEYSVIKFCTCYLMRLNPRPTSNTFGFYYPDNYGPYLGTQVQKVSPRRISLIKRLLKPIASRIFIFNTERLPSLIPGRMLETGCASGAFLHHMAGKGWQVQCIEFSEKAAQAATTLGYEVYTGPLETAPQPREPFDLIVGWMVLEHLHDPLGGLQKLRQWAKPGTRLVISVPNAGSLEFSLFKNKWYSLHLPNHLHHSTPVTVEKILDAGGWQLEKIHHHRTLSDLIANTGYVLRDKGYKKLGQKLVDFPKSAGRWHQVLYPIAWLLSIFGQTGRMTVWARVK